MLSPPSTYRWCLVLSVTAALAGCGNDRATGPGHEQGADFDALFASPTAAEKATVLAGWNTPLAPEGVRVETVDTVMIGARPVVVRILSHLVEGERHVGAITHPLGNGGALPVLLYCHFDTEGIQFEAAVLILTAVAGLRGDQFVYVIPAYRGQSMRLGSRRFSTEGEISLWDGEVTDALSLLHVAWSLPETLPDRAAALGLSAGATVALLAAAREPGIEAVVDYFGPSDFFGPYSEEMLRRIMAGDIPQIRRIPLLARTLVLPWAEGLVPTPQMRLRLLRRSPAHFAARLPPILAHHGMEDAIVDVSQTRRLRDAVAAAAGQIEVWTYPGAGHSPFDMEGALARTVRFLSQVAEPRRTTAPAVTWSRR